MEWPKSYTKVGVAATSLKHSVKGALGASNQTVNHKKYINSSMKDPLKSNRTLLKFTKGNSSTINASAIPTCILPYCYDIPMGKRKRRLG